jgi:hypothetical protein
MWPHFEAEGQAVDVLKSDVPLAALDLPEVAAIQAAQ